MSDLKAFLEHLIRNATAEEERAYLLVDGTWQEDLAERVRAHSDGWEPLMGAYGEHKEDAHMRSPLVIDLSVRPEVLDPWLAEGFPEKLGMVMISPLPLPGIRASLKRFMQMMTPEFEQPAYFRFYDARTLYCFLTTGFPEQWTDFFADITLIAAPSDLSDGWTLYRLNGEHLMIGTDTESASGFQWRTATDTGTTDPYYRVSTPFRRFGESQYERMNACSRRTFHHEIYDFLKKAFPEDITLAPKQDYLSFIEEAHRTAEGEGYDSEDCVFYWAVLSFMGGPAFHLDKNTALYLQIEYLSPENKLEKLIGRANDVIGNPHLRDLIDTIEIEEETEDGTVLRYKERSGRVIESRKGH